MQMYGPQVSICDANEIFKYAFGATNKFQVNIHHDVDFS